MDLITRVDGVSAHRAGQGARSMVWYSRLNYIRAELGIGLVNGVDFDLSPDNRYLVFSALFPKPKPVKGGPNHLVEALFRFGPLDASRPRLERVLPGSTRWPCTTSGTRRARLCYGAACRSSSSRGRSGMPTSPSPIGFTGMFSSQSVTTSWWTCSRFPSLNARRGGSAELRGLLHRYHNGNPSS